MENPIKMDDLEGFTTPYFWKHPNLAGAWKGAKELGVPKIPS